jgi:thioredoxin 1
MENRLKRKRNLLQVIALAITCFISFSGIKASGQNKTAIKHEIVFGDRQWEQTLQLAKKRKQLIFVDAFAVWCGPCKDLKIQTFTDPKVAAYFNSHFINVSMDMEKGDGLKFADHYGVDSYPTLLFINGNGQIVNKSEGFLDAAELLTLAKATGQRIN